MSVISTAPQAEREETPRVESEPFRRERTTLGGLAVATMGLLAVLAVGWWVTNSRLFDLRTLNVSGNERLSRDRVAALAGLGSGTNVLWFRSDSVEKRLESSPWIRSATVSRTLVTERVPVALVGTGRMPFFLSTDGMVLGRAGSDVRLPLIVASMPNLRPGLRIRPGTPALVVANSLPGALRDQVRQIGATGTTIGLRLQTGVRVIFGTDEEAARKGAALVALLDWARIRGVRLDYIDVRAPDAPALKPYVPPAPTPPPASPSPGTTTVSPQPAPSGRR